MATGEDTAVEAYRFVVQLTQPDQLCVRFEGVEYSANVWVHANLLCIRALDGPHEPLVFVLEKFQVRRESPASETDGPWPFSLVFSDDVLILEANSVEQREKWMIRLATSSYKMAQAELDEIGYRLTCMQQAASPLSSPSIAATKRDESKYTHFLTNPFRKAHNFSIGSVQVGRPPRQFSVDECIWESRLSFSVPIELLKLYRTWTTSLISCLEPLRQVSRRTCAVEEAQHHLRHSVEVYEQALEFLTSHVSNGGASYRPSTEKTRVSFGPVPTNLHVHSLQNHGIVTCGTISALAFKFQTGGLSRVNSTASWSTRAEFSYARMSSRLDDLIQLRRMAAETARRVESGSVLARNDALQALSDVKQVFERLQDVARGIPDLEALSEELEETSGGSVFSQRVALESAVVSLNTKVATLEDAHADAAELSTVIRKALVSACERLLAMANTLRSSSLLALCAFLESTQETALYFRVQLATDWASSQFISLASTAILTLVSSGRFWQPIDANGDEEQATGPLITIFSLLSVYGNESNMLDDMVDVCGRLNASSSSLHFKLVRSTLSLVSHCIPQVAPRIASPTALLVTLPVPQHVYDAIPENITRLPSFPVTCALFSLGVNYEAALSHKLGGCRVERDVNERGLAVCRKYVAELQLSASVPTMEALAELESVVNTEPSRKNLSLFSAVQKLTMAVGGMQTICCKSGKDRTSMAVTLEQARQLKESCGLAAHQVEEVCAALRRDGVRREICRKNVGKALYSFGPLNYHFLPAQLRPPPGTYAANLST